MFVVQFLTLNYRKTPLNFMEKHRLLVTNVYELNTAFFVINQNLSW